MIDETGQGPAVADAVVGRGGRRGRRGKSLLSAGLLVRGHTAHLFPLVPNLPKKDSCSLTPPYTNKKIVHMLTA